MAVYPFVTQDLTQGFKNSIAMMQNSFKRVLWFLLKGSFFSLKVEYMFSLAVKAQSRQHDKWVSVVKVKLILPSLTWAIEGGSFIVPWKVIRQSNCILYCPGTSAWRLLEQFIYHGQYSMFCLSALTHPHLLGLHEGFDRDCAWAGAHINQSPCSTLQLT